MLSKNQTGFMLITTSLPVMESLPVEDFTPVLFDARRTRLRLFGAGKVQDVAVQPSRAAFAHLCFTVGARSRVGYITRDIAVLPVVSLAPLAPAFSSDNAAL